MTTVHLPRYRVTVRHHGDFVAARYVNTPDDAGRAYDDLTDAHPGDDVDVFDRETGQALDPFDDLPGEDDEPHTPREWVDVHTAQGHDAHITQIGAPGYGTGSYCFTCHEYGPTTGGVFANPEEA